MYSLRKRALDKYYENPNKCKNCGKVILVPDNVRPSIIRERKFCSHSCAATYNNIGVRRNSSRIEQYCQICNKRYLTYLEENSSCCSRICRDKKRWMDFEEFVQRTGSFPVGKLVTIKKYLLRIRGHRCEVCGLDEWLGNPMPIEIHHIDGNHKNLQVSNFQLMCPNCHVFTPTYKIRKVKYQSTISNNGAIA
jgi:hypothetical protein